MSNPTEDQGVKVIPGEFALRVARITAEHIFARHDNPKQISMDQDGMTQVCALAAQMVLNGITRNWQ